MSTTADRPPTALLRPVGGPVWVAWREGTLTRAYELETLCDWLASTDSADRDGALAKAVRCHLAAARQAARADKTDPSRRFVLLRNGPLIERAESNLDAAEAQLLNLAPPKYVLGQMPSLLRHVQRHLRPADPGRQEFERIARSVGISNPDSAGLLNGEYKRAVDTVDQERGKIVTTVRAASSQALREHIRLRSFRNIVVITTILLGVLAVGVALTGFFRPELVPLCFTPNGTTVVCPINQEKFVQEQDAAAPPNVQDIDNVVARTVTHWDLLVVELVGLTAAAIAAAAAIRRIQGSSERYGIPVALALLKLPTGALTAFLGLMLMRGQFVPGLSALDTSAQILAWALVFGYAQELFTRLVDQQGQSVLNSVRSADKNPRD